MDVDVDVDATGSKSIAFTDNVSDASNSSFLSLSAASRLPALVSSLATFCGRKSCLGRFG